MARPLESSSSVPDSGMRSEHFSMIRSFQAADFLTLANGGCGLLAIFLTLNFADSADRSDLYWAYMLVLLALMFDVADGRVARARREHSAFGRELDSLADIISFGAAPAAIGYAAGLNTWPDTVMLVFFALCGLSRLARYNISAQHAAPNSGAVDYFEGTPIPTSIIPLGILIAGVALETLWPVEIGNVKFHLLAVPFVLFGCLMVSRTLKVPKL